MTQKLISASLPSLNGDGLLSVAIGLAICNKIEKQLCWKDPAVFTLWEGDRVADRNACRGRLRIRTWPGVGPSASSRIHRTEATASSNSSNICQRSLFQPGAF